MYSEIAPVYARRMDRTPSPVSLSASPADESIAVYPTLAPAPMHSMKYPIPSPSHSTPLRPSLPLPK